MSEDLLRVVPDFAQHIATHAVRAASPSDAPARETRAGGSPAGGTAAGETSARRAAAADKAVEVAQRRHQLEVHVDRVEGILVITPVGDVDIVTGGLFLEALIAAISAGETKLIVDLNQVPFMDSTALSIFLSANRALHAVGGRMRVVAGGQRGDIFRFAWVDQLCVVQHCVADAVRDLAGS